MSAGSRNYDEAKRLVESIPSIALAALQQNAAQSTAAAAMQITLAKAQVYATLAVADFTRDK